MPIYATSEQILDAYDGLSFDQLLTLRLYAMRQLQGTQFSEPLDLVHEALYRSVEGTRNWPLAGRLSFGLYMCLTMRSIAHDDRKSHGTRGKVDTMDELSYARAESSRGFYPSAEDVAIALEGQRIAQEAARHARESLGGDEQAQRILNGMLAGMSPREMCASFHIEQKSFHAARERVMRRIKQFGTTLH